MVVADAVEPVLGAVVSEAAVVAIAAVVVVASAVVVSALVVSALVDVVASGLSTNRTAGAGSASSPGSWPSAGISTHRT